MSTTIESIIKRQGGTRVTLGKDSYHFAPNDEGAHVCEVAKAAHIQTFLAIPEGYRIYGADDEENQDTDLSGGLQPNDGEDEPPYELVQRYLDLTGYEEVDVEGMTTEQLEEAIALAEAEKALENDQEGGDDVDDSDGDEDPDHAANEADKSEPVPLERQDPETVDDEALRARFEEIIGEKPHPRMKAETMQARILETIQEVTKG